MHEHLREKKECIADMRKPRKKYNHTTTLVRQAVFEYQGRRWRLRIEGSCAVIHEHVSVDSDANGLEWSSYATGSLKSGRLVKMWGCRQMTEGRSDGPAPYPVPPQIVLAAEAALLRMQTARDAFSMEERSA